MMLDISMQDINEARKRVGVGIKPRHNLHNPIVVALERLHEGCIFVTTDDKLHMCGPSIPDKVLPLSQPAKYLLDNFAKGVAFPVERMQIT